MEYVYLILQLLGGLGAFLVGMEIMSDSMSRLAHGGLKKMLNKTANNRLPASGSGLFLRSSFKVLQPQPSWSSVSSMRGS